MLKEYLKPQDYTTSCAAHHSCGSRTIAALEFPLVIFAGNCF